MKREEPSLHGLAFDPKIKVSSILKLDTQADQLAGYAIQLELEVLLNDPNISEKLNHVLANQLKRRRCGASFSARFSVHQIWKHETISERPGKQQ